MYKKDANNVSDYVQRHLISLSIWEELRFVLVSIFFHARNLSTVHLMGFKVMLMFLDVLL